MTKNAWNRAEVAVAEPYFAFIIFPWFLCVYVFTKLATLLANIACFETVESLEKRLKYVLVLSLLTWSIFHTFSNIFVFDFKHVNIERMIWWVIGNLLRGDGYCNDRRIGLLVSAKQRNAIFTANSTCQIPDLSTHCANFLYGFSFYLLIYLLIYLFIYLFICLFIWRNNFREWVKIWRGYKMTSPLTQDANWTYIGRPEDVLSTFNLSSVSRKLENNPPSKSWKNLQSAKYLIRINIVHE